ncbi:ABC transporter ATP-binding protein [Aquamicrobium zhengzhouense]|uniref:ABC transporter ATP-binding protein n=1 Tax=Aquamicrobium zhengzhouense TaxID=2781738 RepID=UPI002D7FC447|nr:ABC transporter ATP-binding protein [Aquamicrobium zhengzhouense]
MLQNINLKINSGEFLAVLGPSGCGKTTLLRVLAGFEAPSAGEVQLGDQTVAAHGLMVPPEKRGVGIVFQNYALWPHMSVAENVGYALKVARLPRPIREERVGEALATVDLAAFAERRPADLSGGQRQRVALARCLAARNNLVLLDEPLANLDVHLRATMEEEFRRFHRESGATLVYITHDQSEAMALADRVAVMDKGRILQCASPRQLYREPASATVASFIGDGLLFPVENVRPEHAGRVRATLLGVEVALRAEAAQGPVPMAIATCHPSNLRLSGPNEANGLDVVITSRVYRGGRWSFEIRPHADPSLTYTIDLPDHGGSLPQPGEDARVAFDDLWLLPEGQGTQFDFTKTNQSSPTDQKKVFQCV